jgi:hypothetical protein
MAETIPTYTADCAKKSPWQKYEIFGDRVELHSWMGTWKIPFDQIEKVDVYSPVLKSLRLHLLNCLPIGLKLDFAADFKDHVLLDKSTGIARHVLFTPEDPAEFKHVLEERMAAFGGSKASPQE